MQVEWETITSRFFTVEDKQQEGHNSRDGKRQDIPAVKKRFADKSSKTEVDKEAHRNSKQTGSGSSFIYS